MESIIITNTEAALEYLGRSYMRGGPNNTDEWLQFLAWLRRDSLGSLCDSDMISLVKKTIPLGNTYTIDVVSSILMFHEFGEAFNRFIRSITGMRRLKGTINIALISTLQNLGTIF